MTDPASTADTGGAITPQAPQFKRPPLTAQEIFARAAVLNAQIDWKFDEAQAAYIGTAPYGRFVLSRHDEGYLKALFQNTAEMQTPGENGSFNAEIGLNDCDSVTAAKASVTRKLVEALNGSLRDSPLLDDAEPEPDLI